MSELIVSRATDRIDVLYLTHNYPRYDGDFAGRFVAHLAELVTARGVHVAVLAPHHAAAELHEVSGGVRIARFRYARDGDETLAYRGDLGKIRLTGPQGLLAQRRFWKSFRRDARLLVRDWSPRAVHAHWWIPAGWIARGLPFSGRLIVTLHGTDLRLLLTKPWLRPLAARVFARANVITLVSSWLADALIAVYPEYKSRIQVTPMPPNDELFGRGDSSCAVNNPPRILCVTRFTRQKRNGVFLDALSVLRSRNIPFRAVLVGEGPLRNELVRRTESLGLAESVGFLTPRSQSDLVRDYQEADVVVLPAVDEGFGMTMVEAQLCGSAVVGARSGGLTDIIEDGISGLLATPDDPKDLADVLQRILGDGELRSRLAQAGFDSARRRFSSSAIATRFCEWYEATE